MEAVSIKGCARCGQDHELDFKEFDRPSSFCGIVFATHWATCPTTGEPIVMAELSGLDRDKINATGDVLRGAELAVVDAAVAFYDAHTDMPPPREKAELIDRVIELKRAREGARIDGGGSDG